MRIEGVKAPTRKGSEKSACEELGEIGQVTCNYLVMILPWVFTVLLTEDIQFLCISCHHTGEEINDHGARQGLLEECGGVGERILQNL
jgi:hypothetical protein